MEGNAPQPEHHVHLVTKQFNSYKWDEANEIMSQIHINDRPDKGLFGLNSVMFRHQLMEIRDRGI
jgi:hypothetical protein